MVGGGAGVAVYAPGSGLCGVTGPATAAILSLLWSSPTALRYLKVQCIGKQRLNQLRIAPRSFAKAAAFKARVV